LTFDLVNLQQVVIPAPAVIHFDLSLFEIKAKWIPAFAGMTSDLDLLRPSFDL
jgi:hypothetical protein